MTLPGQEHVVALFRHQKRANALARPADADARWEGD